MRRGRVLVIEEQSCSETSGLWSEIQDEGFEVNLTAMDRSAAMVAAAGPPDVVVLNMIAAEMSGDRMRYLDAAARLMMARGSRRLPVIALGGTGSPSPSLGISEIIARPISAVRLTNRIAAIRRLATMQAEARRRADTAIAFGVTMPDFVGPSAGADPTVLVVGASVRYLAVERCLSPKAFIVGAFSTATARDYLARRSFDAVVLNTTVDTAVEMLREFRADPALYTLPVIVLAAAPDREATDQIFAAGATELVEDATLESDLARVIAGSVAEHRFREALRAVYVRGRNLVTSDALTGLFSRGFFMEHAGRLAEIAAEEGEPHAVATLRIDELAGINAEDGYAAGDHLLRQVGSLIGRLTRGEDLAARIGGGRFAVLMPGTDQADAVTALNRVSAILRTTRFIVPGTGRTLQIDPVGRVTALGQSESLEPVLNGLFDGGTV